MNKELATLQQSLVARVWPKELGTTGPTRLQSLALGIAIGRQLRMVGDPMRSVEEGYIEVTGGGLLTNYQQTARLSTLMNYLPMLDTALVEHGAFGAWADRYTALYPAQYITPLSLLGSGYARYHDFVYGTDQQWSKDDLALLNTSIETTLDVINIMTDAWAKTTPRQEAGG